MGRDALPPANLGWYGARASPSEYLYKWNLSIAPLAFAKLVGYTQKSFL
jgi:hypothetical protein